jgi:hypothetical protein
MLNSSVIQTGGFITLYIYPGYKVFVLFIMAVMLFSCQISNENFFATRKEMIIGLNN